MLSVDNVVYRVTAVYRVLSRINVHVRELVPRNACISSLLRNTGDIRQTEKQRLFFHVSKGVATQYRIVASERILLETPTSLVSIPHQFALFKTIRGKLFAAWSLLPAFWLAVWIESKRVKRERERANWRTGERRRFRELELLLWRRRRWRKGQAEGLSIPSITVMTPLLLSSFRCFPYGRRVSQAPSRRSLLLARQLALRESKREHPTTLSRRIRVRIIGYERFRS